VTERGSFLAATRIAVWDPGIGLLIICCLLLSYHNTVFNINVPVASILGAAVYAMGPFDDFIPYPLLPVKVFPIPV
jgi:hypothetical protein